MATQKDHKKVSSLVSSFDSESDNQVEEQLERLKAALRVESDGRLSAILGIARQGVSNARAKKSVPAAWFVKVADMTGASIDWLLYGTGAPMRFESEGAEYRASSQPQPCESDLVMIPKVRARLSAGNGSLETAGEISGHYAFRSDWIRAKGSPQHMVLMEVWGNSMEPDLLEGDTVMVDQSQTDVLAGRIYAVGIDHEVVIKRLDKAPGQLVLKSNNPIYNDIYIDMSEDLADQVRIIGRVIWWCREAR